MDGHLQETLAMSELGATRSREWMHRVICSLRQLLVSFTIKYTQPRVHCLKQPHCCTAD